MLYNQLFNRRLGGTVMAISVGGVKSFKRPTSWSVIPDDRQSRIEIIGGMHVQDYGVVDAGETISCTVVFNATNWEAIKNYWISRTLIEIIDDSGALLGNRRVVVKSYTYVDRFSKYVTATIEFWAI